MDKRTQIKRIISELSVRLESDGYSPVYCVPCVRLFTAGRNDGDWDYQLEGALFLTKDSSTEAYLLDVFDLVQKKSLFCHEMYDNIVVHKLSTWFLSWEGIDGHFGILLPEGFNPNELVKTIMQCTAKEETKKEKKSGFFSRMFGKKKKDKPAAEEPPKERTKRPKIGKVGGFSHVGHVGTNESGKIVIEAKEGTEAEKLFADLESANKVKKKPPPPSQPRVSNMKPQSDLQPPPGGLKPPPSTLKPPPSTLKPPSGNLSSGFGPPGELKISSKPPVPEKSRNDLLADIRKGRALKKVPTSEVRRPKSPKSMMAGKSSSNGNNNKNTESSTPEGFVSSGNPMLDEIRRKASSRGNSKESQKKRVPPKPPSMLKKPKERNLPDPHTSKSKLNPPPNPSNPSPSLKPPPSTLKPPSGNLSSGFGPPGELKISSKPPVPEKSRNDLLADIRKGRALKKVPTSEVRRPKSPKSMMAGKSSSNGNDNRSTESSTSEGFVSSGNPMLDEIRRKAAQRKASIKSNSGSNISKYHTRKDEEIGKPLRKNASSAKQENPGFVSSGNPMLDEIRRKALQRKNNDRQNASGGQEVKKTFKTPPVVPRKPPSSNHQVVAIDIYEASDPSEISLNIGDIVLVKEKKDSNWWIGSTNGSSGEFPATFVREISRHYVTAISNYRSSSSEELSFHENEKIEVLATRDDGWLIAKLRSKSGLVPGNLVKKI